jgi:RNA polymerase sigma factor (sigma-70 family)
VRKAMEELPDDLRKTFLMCQFSDLTQLQIGEVLGIPPGTVASRRNRALFLIREKLKLGENETNDK